MIYQLPDACDISAKIKLLNFMKKAKEEELEEELKGKLDWLLFLRMKISKYTGLWFTRQQVMLSDLTTFLALEIKSLYLS